MFRKFKINLIKIYRSTIQVVYNYNFTSSVDSLEKSPLLRLVAIVGIIFTSFTIWSEINDRKEERIARAWGILTAQAPGNSGKRRALETLFDYEVDLTGLDLSCSAMGGEETDPKDGTRYCARPTFLRNLDMTPRVKLLGMSLFSFQSLTGFWLPKWLLKKNVNLSGSKLSGVDLKGAKFYGANLLNVDLSASYLDGSSFIRSNLTAAIFDSSAISSTTFENSNLTETSFKSTRLSNSVFFENEIKNTDYSNSSLFEAVFVNNYLFSANFGNANISSMFLEDPIDGENVEVNKKGLVIEFIRESSFKNAKFFPNKPPIMGIDVSSDKILVCDLRPFPRKLIQICVSDFLDKKESTDEETF